MFRKTPRLAIVMTALSICACSHVSSMQYVDRTSPHIVLLLADDLGIDVAPCHAETVRMPYLESLCETSVVFERAYTHPVCTPSRATLFTSRHPFQHDAKSVKAESRKLALDEITFVERLNALEDVHYETAGFGKWHLGDDTNGDMLSPNLQGFDYFEGTPRQRDTYSFYNFNWWRNGALMEQKVPTYRTTFIVDRAIEYFESETRSGPQLLYLAFTSPHLPFHAPPTHLHSMGELPPPPKRGPLKTSPRPGFYQANVRDRRLDPYFFAMLEALDNEIERLVSTLNEKSDRPIIFIFASDNGTSPEVYQGDTSAGYRAKGMLYEGGASVPVQVWSTENSVGLKTSRSEDLFHFADLGPTILALAGTSTRDIARFERDTSGYSQIAPLTGDTGKAREFLFLERGNADGAPFAVGSVDQNGKKLIIWESQDLTFPAIEGFSPDQFEFYDTKHDPAETRNLFLTCEADFDLIRKHIDFISETLASESSKSVPFDLFHVKQRLDAQKQTC